MIRSIPQALNLMNGFTPPDARPTPFPADAFWLGTDDQGRDVFSTILFGMRISLFVGFSAVLLAMMSGGHCSACSRATSAAGPRQPVDAHCRRPTHLPSAILDGAADFR
jgi:ABC-type dipeptide/oligopeptide/nickel transport system permease subunit